MENKIKIAKKKVNQIDIYILKCKYIINDWVKFIKYRGAKSIIRSAGEKSEQAAPIL